MDVDRTFVAIPIGAPDAIEKLLTRQRKADIPREERQEIELARGQGDRLSRSARLTATQVHLQVADFHNVVRWRRRPGCAGEWPAPEPPVPAARTA